MPNNKNIVNLLNDTPNILRLVAECAPMIIWGIDSEGTVFLSEGAALNPLGIKPTELVGQNVFNVYAQQPDVLECIRRSLAGESFVMELNIQGVNFESHYKPIKDKHNAVIGVLGVAVDVTEHIQVEQALRESETRYAIAQQAGQIGIWEWDMRTNEVYWSDNIEPMFGLGPGEFSGKYEDYLNFIHEDDRDRFVENINATLKNKSPYKIEHRIIWPDGSVHWLYGAGELFLDEAQQPVRIVGTAHDISERVYAEQELRDSQRDLEMSQELNHMGSWSWDIASNRVSWSKELYRIYGLDPEVEQVNILNLVIEATHPEDRERVMQSIEDTSGSNEDNKIEYRIVRPNGEIRMVWGMGKAISDDKGELIRRIGIVQDITEKSAADANMLKLSRALEQTDDLVMITNRVGSIEFVNEAFQSVTGYQRKELIGQSPSILRSDEHSDSFFKIMWATILNGNSFREVLVNKRKDGSTFYEEKTITPLVDSNGKITHFISTGKDISERIDDQQRMQFLAHHDVLTELPNRVLFLDRLDHALSRRYRHETHLALIFMDIDRFKIINDTLGHDAGDQYLQAFSKRLNLCLREEDTVARIGGDEFAILLEDIETEEQAAAISQKILNSLEKPFILDDREIFITVSLGISVYPGDGKDARSLLKNADIAMYRAKDLGRNTYQFYSPDMSSRVVERLTFESSLRHALERKEYILHYQPQFDASKNRIVGFEALIRWQHPKLGMISPVQFIPILEDTGLIIDVGEWVLREACEQAKIWNSAGHGPLNISVNVSSRQFSSGNFIEILKRVLEQSRIDPLLLEIEITESLLLQNTPDIRATFNSLMDMNVLLTLDDFGTGYSSLSYLKRFPINKLKIDRSFIRDITTDPDDANIVEAIIALSKSMNMQLVAEGVETLKQQTFLQSHDCHILQGFLFSPPVYAEKVPDLLDQNS